MNDALAGWVEAAGGPGLAAAAWLGATLVPISSEAAFVAALRLGLAAPTALAWASAGNALGCGFNYALGRWGRRRLAAEPSPGTARGLRWLERAGPWALLLSWLPVVGDPLTVAAGVARVRPVWFVALVVPLRVARYVALVPLG